MMQRQELTDNVEQDELPKPRMILDELCYTSGQVAKLVGVSRFDVIRLRRKLEREKNEKGAQFGKTMLIRDTDSNRYYYTQHFVNYYRQYLNDRFQFVTV